MRIAKFWFFVGLCLLVVPHGVAPRLFAPVYAQTRNAELRDITHAELLDGISLTMQRLKPLVAFTGICRELGVDAWLLGGSSAAVAFYAKNQLQRFGRIPDEIHFFDVFSPGQDVDVAIDGGMDAIRRVNSARESHGELKAKMAEKSVWDLVTLREHNGRGIVDNRDFMLQHTDSMSLGLIKLNHDSQAPAEIRWAPTFASSGPNANPFLDSVMQGRIEYLFRDTHEQNSQFRAGKNPSVISVLRMLNKAARFSLSISPADQATMQSIIDRFLTTENSVGDYVPGRIHRIVRTMLIGSSDSKHTLKLLRKFKVLKVMKRAGLSADQIGAVVALGRQMVGARAGLFLGNYERVPVDRVLAMPDGAIFEGTSLFGGDRPPALLIPSRLKHVKEVMMAAEVWANRANLQPRAVAEKLSRLGNQLANNAEIWTKNPPVVFLSDLPAGCRDCRDFSVVGHMLFTLAGIPTLITSTSSHTKVYIEIGDAKFLLNTHNGGIDHVSANNATYLQNIWVRQGQDYRRPARSAEDILFERRAADPDVRYTSEQLRQLLQDHPDKVDVFVEAQAKIIRDDRSIAHAIVALSYAEALGEHYAPIHAAIGDLFEEVKVNGISDEAYRGLYSYFDSTAGGSLPENDYSLMIIDAFLERMRSNHTPERNVSDISIKMLARVEGWHSPSAQQAVFTILAQGINFANFPNQSSDFHRRMRQPSVELLPLARHLWLSRNAKLFLSQTMADYAVIESDTAFAELLKFDQGLDVNRARSDVEREFLLNLRSDAEAGDPAALGKLVALVDYVGLRSPQTFDIRAQDDISSFIGELAFTSPLADAEPLRSLLGDIAERSPKFFTSYVNRAHSSATFDRMWWIISRDVVLGEVGKLNGAERSGILTNLLMHAFTEAEADGARLGQIIEQLSLRFPVNGLVKKSDFLKFLSRDRFARLNGLSGSVAIKVALLSDDLNDLDEKYRLVRHLVDRYGEQTLSENYVQSSNLRKLLLDFAKLELRGSVDGASINKFFSAVALELRQQVGNLDFLWVGLNPESLRFLSEDLAQRVFQAAVQQNFFLFLRKFKQNPYLKTDLFAQQVAGSGVPRMLLQSSSRRAAQLLGVMLKLHERQGELPPFIMKLLFQARINLPNASPLFVSRYEKLQTIVNQQITRVPAGARVATDLSETAKSLCQKYLSNLALRAI